MPLSFGTRLSDALPDDEITQTIGSAYQRFDTSPIRDFVPIFVERYARRELHGRTENAEGRPRLEVRGGRVRRQLPGHLEAAMWWPSGGGCRAALSGMMHRRGGSVDPAGPLGVVSAVSCSGPVPTWARRWQVRSTAAAR